MSGGMLLYVSSPSVGDSAARRLVLDMDARVADLFSAFEKETKEKVGVLRWQGKLLTDPSAKLADEGIRPQSTVEVLPPPPPARARAHVWSLPEILNSWYAKAYAIGRGDKHWKEGAFSIFRDDLGFGDNDGGLTAEKLAARATMHIDFMRFYRTGSAEAHRRAAIYQGRKDGMEGRPAKAYDVNAGKPAGCESIGNEKANPVNGRNCGSIVKLTWLPQGWCMAMWREGQPEYAVVPGNGKCVVHCPRPGGPNSAEPQGHGLQAAAALPQPVPIEAHPAAVVRQVYYERILSGLERGEELCDGVGPEAARNVLQQVSAVKGLLKNLLRSNDGGKGGDEGGGDEKRRRLF